MDFLALVFITVYAALWLLVRLLWWGFIDRRMDRHGARHERLE